MESLVVRNTVSNVKNDWIKFGLVFIMTRFLVKTESANFPLNNTGTTSEWLKSVILILIGFAAYEIVIVNLISTDSLFPLKYKSLVNNVLKVGTMLFVARLLSGNSLNDPAWIKMICSFMFGFAVYNISTIYFIDLSHDASENSKIGAMVRSDWVQCGTAFLVARLVLGGPVDQAWFTETAIQLIGFAAYNFFLS